MNVGTVVVPTVASLTIMMFVSAILLCVIQYLLLSSVYIYHTAILSDR